MKGERMTTDAATKTCTKCGRVLPATTEYFRKTPSGKLGLHSWCLDCEREASRARTQRYYQSDNIRSKHYEYMRQYGKEYNQRSEVKEARRLRNRRRYLDDPKVREKAKRYHDKYYEVNHVQLLEYYRNYRRNNRQEIKAYNQHRNARDREQCRIHYHNYQARKRALPNSYTLEHQQFALEYFNGCCAVCGRPFYDLFSERTMALDHWIPISSDDCPGTTPTNIVPLCHGVDGCNTRKQARDPQEWLVSQFGKRKAREIMARVEQYFDAVRERFDDGDDQP